MLMRHRTWPLCTQLVRHMHNVLKVASTLPQKQLPHRPHVRKGSLSLRPFFLHPQCPKYALDTLHNQIYHLIGCIVNASAVYCFISQNIHQSHVSIAMLIEIRRLYLFCAKAKRLFTLLNQFDNPGYILHTHIVDPCVIFLQNFFFWNPEFSTEWIAFRRKTDATSDLSLSWPTEWVSLLIKGCSFASSFSGTLA